MVQECEEADCLGIPAVILFGIPERKDPAGTEAYSDHGVVQQVLKPAGIALSALCERQIGHSCVLAESAHAVSVSGEVNDRKRFAHPCEPASFGSVAEIDRDLLEWNYGEYDGRLTIDIHKERPDWRLQASERRVPAGNARWKKGARQL